MRLLLLTTNIIQSFYLDNKRLAWYYLGVSIRREEGGPVLATTQLKEGDLTVDELFWENTYGDRNTVLLSSHQKPVPIAKILHNGKKTEVADLARRAAAGFSLIREIEITNTGLVLKVPTNGKMHEDEAAELRDLYLAKLRELVSNPDSHHNTQRRAGRRPPAHSPMVINRFAGADRGYRGMSG